MLQNILKHFTHRDLVVFFVSFCVGVLFVCLVENKPEVIVRWPTPDNAGLVTYVDRANNCYKYESNKVGCTDDAKHIPIQSGEGMISASDEPDEPGILQQGNSQIKRHTTDTIVVPKQSWEKSFV